MTRRQIQEKRERFYERMIWVQVAALVGLGVYCIGVLGL
jgi:hypothetical protein